MPVLGSHRFKSDFIHEEPLTLFYTGNSYKKVQVGKDQAKAQSERDSHSKTELGKKTN